MSLTEPFTGFGGLPFMFTVVTLAAVWLNVGRLALAVRSGHPKTTAYASS